MSESPYIHNVSAQDFKERVIDLSFQHPVLVDFWADWCQPCKTLMPLLARLADEYAGKFTLAKVDTEQQQELAAHFQIKSLPTMKLFVNGQIADERSGALPESEIRKFIDQYITSETDILMQAAMQASQEGRQDDALALMNQALAADPQNHELKISIAGMLMAQGDQDGALALLDSLDSEAQQLAGALKLRAEINLAEQLKDLPGLAQIEQTLEQEPNNLQALLDKSRHNTAQGDYAQAMECLLQIMRLDRAFEQDGGRMGLLALFDLLGGEHPDVQIYRRKLFTLLH